MWSGVLYSALFRLFLRMPVFTQQAAYFSSRIMTDVVWESLSVKSPLFFFVETESSRFFSRPGIIKTQNIIFWQTFLNERTCVCGICVCVYIYNKFIIFCINACLCPLLLTSRMPPPKLHRTFWNILLYPSWLGVVSFDQTRWNNFILLHEAFVSFTNCGFKITLHRAL